MKIRGRQSMGLKRSKILAVILSAAACLAMIAFPHVSLEAARKGMKLWALTVVPALLPFFICAGFMMRMGVPGRIARYFEKPVRTFFCVPGCAAFAFLMSVVSGYPMGAKITADLREQRLVSKREAERMLSFCSTSGPLFMLGAVGAGMLGSVAAGWVIAISHYTAAIINGLLFRRHGKPGGAAPLPLQSSAQSAFKAEESGMAVLLTDSIFSAARTLLLIGGYILMFTLLTSFLDEVSFFVLLKNSALAGLAKGLLEFTVGCSAVSASELTLLAKCIICSAIISWGGLSTHFQVAGVLGKTDVSMGFYVRAKLAHACLSAVISLGLGGLLMNLGGTSAQAGEAGLFENELAGGITAVSGGITAFGMRALEAASDRIVEATKGADLLAPSYMQVTSFEAAQIFINKLLFSSQMIIMVMVLFALVSMIGRLSYRLSIWIKKILLRRRYAREEARAEAARAEATRAEETAGI